MLNIFSHSIFPIFVILAHVERLNFLAKMHFLKKFKYLKNGEELGLGTDFGPPLDDTPPPVLDGPHRDMPSNSPHPQWIKIPSAGDPKKCLPKQACELIFVHKDSLGTRSPACDIIRQFIGPTMNMNGVN